MHPTAPMLGPVIALALWTFVMWAWMYVTRIPAVQAAKMRLDPNAPRGEQMNQLPPAVRWKADNYNHLFEMPTLFYAVGVSLAILGDFSAVSLALAWTYVALRVVHSLWQALLNVIVPRFLLFFVSSLVLLALTVRAALLALQ